MQRECQRLSGKIVARNDFVAIVYGKLLAILRDRGITSYTFKQNGIVGQSAWKKIHDGGNIDMRTLNSLCEYLNCQPGDLIEYVPDKQLMEE